ncbi:DNA polymerase IV [bioreactor metagenome]|uniref:DNA polymerase IV n=1 Tax=bioreactor metagenome TaxID=1076179 RepID=A0A645BLN2_9ZZZZ
MDRIILHCDLNGFYASVELLEHPELRDCPVAVCGDPQLRHGIILAKNEPAKAFGVKTAETIWQAKRKCPELVLLPAHHEKYARYSKLVNGIYARFTDLVEPFGIDESWLDVTHCLHLFACSPGELADRIRATVHTELGLTISVGVSFNKVFAKLGSDYRKPDATTVITRENFQTLVWPLPVKDLLFVGASAARLLRSYGVQTIGGLAAFGREELCALLGKQGATLHDYATGADRSPVVPPSPGDMPKSVGNGLTFPKDLLGRDEVRAGLGMLSERVAARLRRHGLKCTAVQVTIRDPGFRDICRQKHLAAPTCVSQEISQTALELVLSAWSMSAPIRALTVTALDLLPEAEAGEQMSLFGAGTARRDKLERLERTMDRIRGKYGSSSVFFASSQPPED